MTKTIHLGNINDHLDGQASKRALVFEGMTRNVLVFDRASGQLLQRIKSYQTERQ